MKSRKLRRIWGEPWDYGYLLDIEQHKIREMARYIKKHHHLANWESVVRDLELCDRLIDIICEKDALYLSWLRESYGQIPIKETKFPVHVNTRNYKRFVPLADLEKLNLSIYQTWLSSLRQIKAMHLYNKIRAYNMSSWWD